MERNLHEILSNGLTSHNRGNRDGYTKNDLIFECDKHLDLLNENLSLNKPKRLESNFAWLNKEHAKRIHLHSGEKEVIIRLEVDPSMVFVSHQLLWNAAYNFYRNQCFNFPESSFEELGFIYWSNVINLDVFLSTKPEIKFPDDFNESLKNRFRTYWKSSDLFEVITR